MMVHEPVQPVTDDSVCVGCGEVWPCSAEVAVRDGVTPDEVETGRLDLIAKLREVEGRGRNNYGYYEIYDYTLADLLAVLEALKPVCLGDGVCTNPHCQKHGVRVDALPHLAEALEPVVVGREAAIQALVAASSRTERVLGREFVEGWADDFADAVLAALYPKATEGKS